MKQMLSRLAMLALAATVFALPASASDSAEKTKLIREANRTVNHLKTDAAFAQAAKMIRNARGVYIVPKLIKGGFIFGAEGGSGVLLRRTSKGWGEPGIYHMGSASFGLQIGLEKAELVFILNSERAVRGITKGNFKLGAGAGITVVTLSSGAEGATTSRGGDIVVWTSGTGAYGGLTFNGTVIDPDDDLNAAPTNRAASNQLRANLASVR